MIFALDILWCNKSYKSNKSSLNIEIAWLPLKSYIDSNAWTKPIGYWSIRCSVARGPFPLVPGPPGACRTHGVHAGLPICVPSIFSINTTLDTCKGTFLQFSLKNIYKLRNLQPIVLISRTIIQQVTMLHNNVYKYIYPKVFTLSFIYSTYYVLKYKSKLHTHLHYIYVHKVHNGWGWKNWF